MRWKSFLRFFTRAWRQAKIPLRKRPDSRYRRLTIDVLEQRELLSAPPTILQAGVLPVTGSTTSATPTLQIEFSDSMTAAALNSSNYILLGSSGTLVPITNVSFVAGTPLADQEVALTYNSGNPGNALLVDTYTLYVRGNDLFSASTGLAMSQPGQLFAANSGRNDLSVVNIPGTGTLGSVSNYSSGVFTSPAASLPYAVAFGDLSGNGIPDMIVADEGTNEVNIFAGQSAANGGGFNSTPVVTLALPAATPTVSTAESIVLGDFNGATFATGEPELDIAVASGNSDNVTVFLNTSTAVGITSIGAGTSYAVDADPVGIAAGNFDGNAAGNLSLAVLASTDPTAIAPDPNLTYRVDLLPGVGNGTFGAIQDINVGDVSPKGVTTPSSIASGVFKAGALPTLVVGGANGMEVLTNTSTPGAFSFAVPAGLLSTTPIVSVAVGPLSAGGENSIAAATTGNTVQVFQNNGAGGFEPMYTEAAAVGTTGQVAIGALNNAGDGDIVVSNSNAAAGGVTVVKNMTVGGTVTSASRTAGNLIVIDAPGNNLVTGQSVTITGDTFGAANVTDQQITLVGDTINSISASAGIVTVTTSTSLYGLAVGDNVTVAGTGVGDGTFAVATIVGNAFTYTDANASGSAAIGSWTDPGKFTLNATTGGPANGTGGTWALVGGITAASEVGGVGPIVITSPNNGLVTGDSVSIQGVPGFAAVNNTLSGVITNTSPAGNNPIQIFTNTTGLVAGMTVTISGVLGDTNANGTWTITSVAPTTFNIMPPAPGSGPGNYTGGGVWTVDGGNAITVLGAGITQANVLSAGVVTITTQSTYGLAPGDNIVISGNSLAAADDPATSPVTIVGIAGNTFTFNNAAAVLGASGTGGTWTSPNKFTLNGTNTAGASSGAGGTWTTTTSFSTGRAVTGSTTTGNPSVTLNSTVGLSVGMAVTGAPIPAGTTIASILSSTQILLSQNANATNAGVALTFTTFYSTDAQPVGIALDDTSQDGNLDVVSANFGPAANDLSLLLGNGDGTLQAPANISVTSANTLQNVVVADLNDSGVPDIIVANNTNGDANTKITIYPGLGNGDYGPGISFTPGNVQNIVGIAVGHFSNANGSSADFPDIVYADGNGFDNTIGFLQNNMTVAGTAITAASFAPTATVGTGASGGLTTLAVGDFNNTGLDDVLVSGQFASGGHHFGTVPGVAVLINNSTNANNFQFTASTPYDTGAAGNISAIAVGDFNNDGNLDFVAAVNAAPGQVILNTGSGTGTFNAGTSFFTTVPNPVSIAVGDFSNNGYQDVVVASSSIAATNAGVAVLMNQLGTGFGTPIVTAVAPGTALRNVVVSDINGDGVPDIAVSTAITTGGITNTSASGTTPITIDTNSTTGLANGDTVTISGVQGDTAANGTWTITNVVAGGGHGPAPSFQLVGSTANANATANTGTWVLGNTDDNVYVLIGQGTGAFASPIPYLVGPGGTPFLAPTFLAITPSPLLPVTTFTSSGDLIQTQLVNNGNFDSRDLSGEQGNLLGWNAYNDPFGAGSAGAWVAETGTTSPLSGTAVPAPTGGNYQAMLDEPNVVPVYAQNMPPNGNTVGSYSGGHALYQDVTIPANATAANFSLSLYINDTGLGVTGAGGYSDPTASDPGGNASLNFNSALANQQVRVDIMQVNLIASASDAGPIVITNANNAADGLTSGEQVTITGVEGNTAANGTWFVKVIDAFQFALYADPAFTDPIVGNGIYTGGGNWTNNFLSVNTLASGGTDPVLEQLFQTYGASDLTVPSGIPFITDSPTYTGTISASLLAFKGQTIRIRVAAVNNQGPLIVGVNNVTLNVQFADSPVVLPGAAPTLTNLAVNNPSFFSGGVPYTNDPTITGTIISPYGLTNTIAYVAFDPTNGNFTSPSVVKTTQWDATGNFSYTLPDATPGLNTIGIEVVDRAGNIDQTTFSFYLLTNSVTQWDPVGPQGIDVTGQGVNYTKISGRITATMTDSLDPSGNTYLVGSVNGGIWRTTDGGNNWTSVTNNVTDAGTPIAVNVGAMAQAAGNPNVMYAATGVADDQLDSQAGVGILKSVNDGLTWTFLPGSAADFNGARVSAMVVDPNDPTGKIVFAAIAAGGAGPGVYRSIDGGATWTNITLPATNMYQTVAPNYLPFNTGSPVIGGAMGSVTSMVINPYNTFGELVIGIGSIGLGVAAGATGGVWMTTNAFPSSPGVNTPVSWAQVVGNNGNAPPNAGSIQNDGLPTGAGLGRVTVTIGTATSSEDKYLYVMIATPPAPVTAVVAPSLVNYGDFSGLYKSSDNGLNFTQVMLNEDTGTGVPNTATGVTFTPINVLGGDGANVGSLAISPSDPNVVYVGGSSYWDQEQIGAGPQLVPNHALLYVDTGDMISGTMDFGLNNGDDQQKYQQGQNQVDYNPAPAGLANDPYTGEGVYWYDMIEGASGTTPKNPLTLLPAEITSLSFDAQGRLLVGTVGGLWRGINNGFSYDFTSGNTGILTQHGGMHGPPPAPFSTPGMSFTSINGNLQISDMTSVAIDPTNAGSYFTTQVDTGVATDSAANGWVSDGLTGPTTAGGQNLGIPTAVTILTATTATGSVDLYRIWEYANTGALLPEVSTDGGATWNSISAVPGGVTAGLLPAFAINPTVLYSGSPALPFNQLLFGSSDPVVTVDSSNTWNAVGAPAGIAAGALPSAAAIAPSNDETYYIGDDEGEVWATVSGGGGSNAWTLAAGAANGLPAVSANSPIEAITVNPTNAANLFVMYGGTTSTGIQVYESTNSGVSFVPVAGPWGAAQAYSMVIDSTAALGAPSGKIYLATQVGVYVSINNGANWSVLGQGMPNVPVVDLAYNSSLQVLAAATLGRGILTINTSAISVVPTQALNENTPAAPTTSAVIPLTVNDVGGVSYTLSATSSNQSLIANGNIHIAPGSGSSLSGSNFTGSNVNLQFTPTLDAYNTPVNGQGGPGDGDWQGPNSGATAETITLTLTSGSFVSTQTFNVAVDFVDIPPTLTSPGNQTILTNTSSPPIGITVSDVQTPAGALVLQASSNNQALIPTANLVLGGSASITAATWNANTASITAANTFAAGQQVVIAGMTPAGYNGTYTIATANAAGFTYTLTTNPGEPGGTTPITAATWSANLVTITAANTFTAGELVTIAGMTPAGYNGTYPIANANATSFTYALTPTPGLATAFGTATVSGTLGTATTGNRTLTITPAANQIGSAVITLTVTDSNGGITQQTFNVLVTTAVTLPDTDNFNVPGTSVFTGPGWVTNSGATPRVNGKIVSSTAGANDATLNGLAQSNVALQEDVVVGAAAGQYAGLVARYGGVVPITAASWTAGKATISAANTFTKGQTVVISGMTPLGYDGSFTITSATSTSFTYALAANPGGAGTPPFGTATVNIGDTSMYWGAIDSYGTGYVAVIGKVINGVAYNLSYDYFSAAVTALPITAATWNAGTVSITSANNYSAGQKVVISGMTPSGYNGTFTIVTASATGFTYALTKNPGLETTLGTASVGGDGTLFFDVTGSSLKLYYGPTGTTTPTLLTYAFDSSLTTGSAGFRISGSATGATSLDNFAAAAIPAPASQSLPFLENFGTAGTLYTIANSSNQLDANWVGVSGDFQDNTGASTAVGLSAAAANIAVVAGVNDADVSVQANVTLSAGQYAGVVARYEGPTAVGQGPNSNFYAAFLDQYSSQNAIVYIYRNYAGSVALVGSSSSFLNTPGTSTFTFQVVGNSLKAYVNGTLKAYADDTLVTSGHGSLVPGGSVGIYGSAGASISGFSATDITPTPALPVVTASPTTFNLTSESPAQTTLNITPSQLDNTVWVEQAGNFTTSVAAGAVGNAAVNIATLDGANNANVSVQATVTLNAGQYAGLVARYEGPTTFGQGANTNYYTAWLDQYSSTRAVVYIFRNYAGTMSLIGSSATFLSTPGTATTLTFQVEGNSLKAFVNGALAAYAQDTLVTSPAGSLVPGGSVGIYASAGAALNNFTASDITPSPVPGGVLPAAPGAFPESFAGPTQTNQLNNATWVEQAGNFTDNGSSAVGNAATNIATIFGVNDANVSVQATVTLNSGQYAGLVARYEGPTMFGQGANANYYTAWLDQYSSTKAIVYIFRNYAGTLSLIGSSASFLSTPGTPTTLTFQVEGNSLKAFVNGALAAYAQNTLVTSAPGSLVLGGSVGIYGSAGAALSNFSASDITPSPVPGGILPAAPATFSDNFGTPTQTNQLNNATWVEQSGNFTDNGANAAGNAGTNVATVFGVNDPNVSVQATVTLNAGQEAGVVARYEGPTVFGQGANANYYLAMLDQFNSQDAVVYIFRATSAGGLVMIGSSGAFVNAPGTSTVTFQVEGTSLKAYVGAKLAAYAQDGTLTTGSVGIYGSSSAIFTSFAASSIGVSQSVGFSDPLTAGSGPSADQLNNASWTEQAGNFNVSASGAKGQAADNLATVFGLSYADQTLQAAFAFSAANQTASLVARYTGPFDANYYYASITSENAAGTIVAVKLFKNVHGVVTQLGSTVVDSAYTGGLTTFSVIGNTLTVTTFDGTQVTATDNSITAAGSAGFRTTAGPTVSNFSAN